MTDGKRSGCQRLLRQVDDPGSPAIETDLQVLLKRVTDWSADALGGMITSGDADGRASGVNNRSDFAFSVEFEQITIGTARLHPVACLDAAGGHLDQIDRIGRPADANDCPLFAGGVRLFPPEDLHRSVGLGLQGVAAGRGHVGEAVPSLGNIDLGRHDAIKHDATDLVSRNRFDGDPNAAGVFVFSRIDCPNRGVADEAGQFRVADFRIGQRRFETDDATDRNRVGRGIMDPSP